MSSRGQSHKMHFQVVSQNILSPEERELYELTNLTGVVLDPPVFKIIMDLLRMNVAPTAIHEMLKSMCGSRRKKPVSGDSIPSHRSRREGSNSVDIGGTGPYRGRSGSKGKGGLHRIDTVTGR